MNTKYNQNSLTRVFYPSYWVDRRDAVCRQQKTEKNNNFITEKYSDVLAKDYSNKTIVFIFAGRKNCMEILLNYLDVLMQKNLIDEVHLWNFSRNTQDDNWIDSLSDKYKIFKTDAPIDEKQVDQYTFWKLPYIFYSNKAFSNTNFIKIDDDIVFVDTHKFEKYLDTLKNMDQQKHYMLSANVVNNGICDYYRQQQQLIPENIAKLDFPNDGDLGVANEKFWQSGVKSEKIHHYFLDNYENFLNANPKDTTQELETGIRLSINFVGFKGNGIFSYYKNSRELDDEEFFSTVLSTKINKKILIFNDFLVAHLHFRTQIKQNNEALIKRYNNLKCVFLKK